MEEAQVMDYYKKRLRLDKDMNMVEKMLQNKLKLKQERDAEAVSSVRIDEIINDIKRV